jgi:hypothetical protein
MLKSMMEPSICFLYCCQRNAKYYIIIKIYDTFYGSFTPTLNFFRNLVFMVIYCTYERHTFFFLPVRFVPNFCEARVNTKHCKAQDPLLTANYWGRIYSCGGLYQ